MRDCKVDGREGNREGVLIILQIYFPGIIDIRLQKRAFHSRFDRFIKQFKVCQNQLNGCMSPQVQRREKGKNPFCSTESKTSILQLKGSIRIVISPADIQKIIGTDDNIPGAVQAIQFLLRTEPDTPFVILQQAVDGIGNQIVIYGIGMRLFPIRPNTYKAFPVCSQPGIAGGGLHQATDRIMQRDVSKRLMPLRVSRLLIKDGQPAATGNQ